MSRSLYMCRRDIETGIVALQDTVLDAFPALGRGAFLLALLWDGGDLFLDAGRGRLYQPGSKLRQPQPLTFATSAEANAAGEEWVRRNPSVLGYFRIELIAGAEYPSVTERGGCRVRVQKGLVEVMVDGKPRVDELLALYLDEGWLGYYRTREEVLARLRTWEEEGR